MKRKYRITDIKKHDKQIIWSTETRTLNGVQRKKTLTVSDSDNVFMLHYVWFIVQNLIMQISCFTLSLIMCNHKIQGSMYDVP